MKLKKIEISAFRIYNNPEYSVFDLTSNSGETAEFVSLYAPNGFGKTSFYDAVEWGVTGSVNRFFIRNKELNKLEINQSSQNKIPLLRNSKLERDTYVRVFSNSDENIFEQKISKNSTASDLPLKKNAEAHGFHKVILSQEWISAFLTEQNGEQRYNKFMENPELSGINDYYLNLKHLLSAQDAEEKQIKSKINELKKQVKNIGEQNLLETINLQIAKINQICEEKAFSLIEIETTDKELIVINDQITRKIGSCENEKQSLINKIDKLRLATTGGDELLSLKSFGDTKAALPNILKEIENIEKLLKEFDEKEKTANELTNLEQSLKELSTKKETVEIILSKYNQFESTNTEIKSKADKQAELQNNLPKLNEKIEKFNREEISINEQLKSSLQEIAVSEEKKKALPSLEKDIKDIANTLSEINKDLTAQNSKIAPLEKQIKDLKAESLEYNTLRNQLQDAKYSTKYIDEKSELIVLVNELNQIYTKLSTEKVNLQLLNEKIEKQQDLNSTIQSFIEQGLAIVNERQSSKCPLCEQLYPDLTTLANKISKNNALSDVLKGLLNQKQLLNETINRFEETIKTGNQRLKEYYTSKIDIKATEISGKLESIESIKKLIKDGNDKLDTLKSKNAELSTSMLGLSLIDYKKHLDVLIDAGLKSKEKYTKDLTNCRDSLKVNNALLEKQNNEITLIKQEKEKLQGNTNYTEVTEYYKANYPSQGIIKSLIDKSFENYKNDILTIRVKIKSLNEVLVSLKEKLSKFKEENLKNKKTELEQKKSFSDDELNKYVLYFKENFEFNINTSKVDEISQFLENTNTDNNGLLRNNKLIHDELITLEKNSQHISEFLQTERTKIKIQTKELELSFLELSVRPKIEDERKSAKVFLEKRIRDFFFEKLINKLYSKIDPHPDFKEVKFTPNLDAEPPRLDVFVKNKDSEFLIPNLYFSTAQINILSLCIFLASALKSTEYDCIFIDDPIQSMDNINVLSTIDLLRSIVVNHKKQIIISTHDENFHNLLKKKMPRDLFKSKFLKLESFGKVINDET
ncbi:AAA family ATPase [Labilibaculum euxinus]|uniref:AAA family ATPase n=1 Tax=Labilibaculum euxinus TaxID=2686357 RepID=A0A7M4DB24_9BACT|nr:AAA family ATPase [Labilibaculum euxinus]MUP39853.1 AAA family ATPase [Labilibaculum euxinus]MVB09058.1 AAA family ATPase [Labilibaculum euxinus]